MNSNGATLEGAMTFCPDDETDGFKYKIGDKFIVKRQLVEEIKKGLNNGGHYSLVYTMLPEEVNTIFTIDSYCINIHGELCYRLVSNGNFIGKWQCTEEDLDKEFCKIDHVRFALLDE